MGSFHCTSISARSIMFSLLILGFCVVFVDADPVVQCAPSKERYFISDTEQCDRFHMCDTEGNLAAEFLCQDGLIYEPISKQCALPFKKTGNPCEGRPVSQEPKPVGRCQRQNGRWAVDNTCDEYIDCVSGVERSVKCQNFQVFDLKAGIVSTLMLLFGLVVPL